MHGGDDKHVSYVQKKWYGEYLYIRKEMGNHILGIHIIISSVRPQLSAELAPWLIIRHRNVFRLQLKVLQTDLHLLYKMICR